jgi:hypothetical protein
MATAVFWNSSKAEEGVCQSHGRQRTYWSLNRDGWPNPWSRRRPTHGNISLRSLSQKLDRFRSFVDLHILVNRQASKKEKRRNVPLRSLWCEYRHTTCAHLPHIRHQLFKPLFHLVNNAIPLLSLLLKGLGVLTFR